MSACPACRKAVVFNKDLGVGELAYLGCCGNPYHLCPEYQGGSSISSGGKKFYVGVLWPGYCHHCIDIQGK